MSKKIKNLVLAISALFIMFAPATALAFPALGATTPDDSAGSSGGATPQSAVCTGANNLALPTDATPVASGACASDTSGGVSRVNQIITDILNIFSVVVGLVAVVMIIVAGFRYITSGGKDESVKGAKNTILYAVIGLVIVALAQVIVKFVLNKATTG